MLSDGEVAEHGSHEELLALGGHHARMYRQQADAYSCGASSHAMPFKSPVTNPYLGEPVGTPAWVSVALCVGAGTWAAYEGLTPSTE